MFVGRHLSRTDNRLAAPEIQGESVSQKQHNEDRMRRAISWHKRSLCAESDDDRFIFLWIAFNAAYGGEPYGPDISGSRIQERDKFSVFLDRVLEVDSTGRIGDLLWRELSGQIRDLLNNRFVYCPFWHSVRHRTFNWRTDFDDLNEEVKVRLERKQDARYVLGEVLQRLYTLRNQILHGGATYGTGKGQGQVRVGASIMKSLVPIILAVMQADIDKNPRSEVWGVVSYPTVNRSGRVV